MNMPSFCFTSGSQATQPPSPQPQVGHHSGLCSINCQQHTPQSCHSTSQIHTLNNNIPMRQPLPRPSHLIKSLLVRPRIPRLVLSASPAVSAAGVRLGGRVASSRVGHCLDCFVLFGAVGEGAVRAFAVGVGEVSARSGCRHGGLCL